MKRKGFDALHTDDLTKKEKTTDKEIRSVSIEQDRIVITKDTDFLDSHLIKGIPQKLLLITAGNIVNRELLNMIEKQFDTVMQLFDIYDLIEINNEEII